MDTTDPDITFDEQGHCNHCRSAAERLATYWHPDQTGRDLLQAKADEIKQYGAGKEYDSIIGVSGGVDSSYVLHVAKTIMGLRPLAVHVDAGWNSEIAVRNIEAMITALDIDLFTYVVDWEEVKDLQLAFLRASVANQDIPQDHAFASKLYAFAVENDIRYVVTGSNSTSESILPDSWGYDSTDRRHLMGIHKRFGTRPLKTFPTMSLYKFRVYWPMIRRMQRFAPLDYLPYDKNKAIAELEATYGWRYYGGKHHESHWTRFFQSYYLPHKFGYDKRKAHYSSLIMAGQMTREEALGELASSPYDDRDIAEEKRYIARKLGITADELDRLIALPNKTYRDYPNNERLITLLRRGKLLASSGKGMAASARGRVRRSNREAAG